MLIGLAISADNVFYFADGTNIRRVDQDGIISTIIGNHAHRTHWNPMPCEGTLPLNEVTNPVPLQPILDRSNSHPTDR